MTDATETPAAAPGILASLLALLTSLKGYLPPSEAVWTGLFYVAIALFGGSLGVVGTKTLTEPEKVRDERAIEAAVTDVRQREGYVAAKQVEATREALSSEQLSRMSVACETAVMNALKKKK